MRSLSGALLFGWLIACGDDQVPLGGEGAGGEAAGGGGAAPDLAGCDGATLLPRSSDRSVAGPWPVGARTAVVDGLTVEVWYPGAPGSEGGVAPLTYDVRSYLPASEQGKIPDAKAPLQDCSCFPDLPLDVEHGPYPIVLFVHGTAGFRTQSLEITTHWASRGFVVLAADHPGLFLGDLITSLPMCDGEAPAQDLEADIGALVSAIAAPSGDLAFLAGSVAPQLLGMSGHSAGGGAIESQGNVARVLIPMAAGGVAAGDVLESVLVMGGLEDQVVSYTNQVSGYETTASATKRLVGLSPAGHLVFSSLCAITNTDGEDIVSIGTEADVCGLALAGALFDCDRAYMAAERGWTVVNDATSAALEETLHCDAGAAEALATLKDRYEEVAELEEAVP